MKPVPPAPAPFLPAHSRPTPTLAPEEKSIKLTACGFLFSGGRAGIRHPAKWVRNRASMLNATQQTDIQNSFLKLTAINLLNIITMAHFPHPALIPNLGNTLLPWTHIGKKFNYNRLQRMAHSEGQNRPKAFKRRRKTTRSIRLREVPAHLQFLLLFILTSSF